MAKEDVLVTTQEPHWQTEWDTEYIQDEEKEKFSLKNFDYPEKPLKYKHIRRISD